MALRKENLDSIKELLHQRRSSVIHELQKATSSIIAVEEAHTDAVDQASADTDRSFMVQMANRDRTILLQIDEALRRMDVGAFGECETCGEEIAEGRLRAFPFTTLCIDCKDELESKEHRFPGRTVSL